MKIRTWRIIILLFILGVAGIRYFYWWPKFSAGDLAYYNNKDELTFLGLVIREPEEKIDKIRLVVEGRELRGRVLVTTDLYPRYQYGDLLKITCQLQTPETIEDFAYDKYLAKDKVWSLCYRGQIELVVKDQGSWLISKILAIKQRFGLIINRSLAFPYSALLMATLFGGRQGMPADLANAFSRVGITHIIAVSGSHVVLITVFLSNFFLALGIRRKIAFYFVVLSLVLFLVMIGYPAAAVRAVIMGLTSLLAMQVGRLSNSSPALFFSASVMLAINPFLLFYDVGFQLSFLATWGMITLSRPVSWLFRKIKLRIPEAFGLRESLTATLAAQIATLPLITYQFGQISLIAPLANLLILPVVPLIMLLGFLAVLAGLISLSLSQILFWLGYPLLWYFIKTTELLSVLPGSAISGVKAGPGWLAISYLFLGLAVYSRRLSKSFKMVSKSKLWSRLKK